MVRLDPALFDRQLGGRVIVFRFPEQIPTSPIERLVSRGRIVTHLFSNGITCTFVFDPQLHYHSETKSISPAKHWSRKFDDAEADAILPEYRAWAHTVHDEIANLLGGPCTYVLQDSVADRNLSDVDWIQSSSSRVLEPAES